MTLKKSMISIAAAGVIAAGFTGCGSSSDTPTIMSYGKSVTAVDGYIYNGSVYATYVDGKNDRVGCDYITNYVKEDASTNLLLKRGSPTYTANTECAGKSPLFFTLVGNAAQAGDDNNPDTVYAARFIDVDGDGKRGDASEGGTSVDVDIAMPSLFALNLPGQTLITPLTTVVYAAMNQDIQEATDINTSIVASAKTTAENIMKKFGLSGVDVHSADPVQLKKSNPTLALVTAIVGQSTFNARSADSKTIKETIDALPEVAVAADGTPDLVQVFANIENAGIAVGANPVTFMKSLLSTHDNNSTAILAEVASSKIFLETSANTGNIVLNKRAPQKNAFVIQEPELDNVDVDQLTAKGAKLDNTRSVLTIPVLTTINTARVNAAETTETLHISVTGAKTNERFDKASPDTVVIKLPITMSIDNGKLIASSAKNQITYASKNDTTKNAAVTELGTDFLTNINSFVTATNAGTTGDISVDIKKLVEQVTARHKGMDNNEVNMTNIADVKVYLTNNNGKIFGSTAAPVTTTNATGATTNTNGYITVLPTGDFSDYDLDTNTTLMDAKGAIKIVDNATLDSRSAGYTGENSVPDNVMTAKAHTPLTPYTSPDGTTITGSERVNAKKFNAYTNTANFSKVELLLGAATNDDWETNTSVDFNKTALTAKFYYQDVEKELTDGTVVTIEDLNTTAATNMTDFGSQMATNGNLFKSRGNTFDTNSTDIGKIVATMPYKLTDEFGKTNDLDVNITINRAPYGLSKYTVTSKEANSSTAANVAKTDSNVTIGKALDYDYENDTNYEFKAGDLFVTAINAGGLTWTNKNDLNVTAGVADATKGHIITIDANSSTAGVDESIEINATLVVSQFNDINLSLDSNDTNWTFADVNITISDYNITDQYGATRRMNTDDTNITINLD